MNRFADTSRVIKLIAFATLGLALGATGADAGSHSDAPRIAVDQSANLTDVFAFVSQDDGMDYLSTSLSVHPFQNPSSGPNSYGFDDDVLYAINLSLGDDFAAGKTTLSYQFNFKTTYKDTSTILQSFRKQASGTVIEAVGDDAQNRTQTYTVTAVDQRLPRKKRTKVLGTGIVPPNNQGKVTPYYNVDDDGNKATRGGVATADELNRYTQAAIARFVTGHRVFAGQSDDPFFSDLTALFDGVTFRAAPDPPADDQRGLNVLSIALDIPIDELGGDMQVVGVHATTSRRATRTFGRPGKEDRIRGKWTQVARVGNPLFSEAFVAIKDKDRFNRSTPTDDDKRFADYALQPELARLLNEFVFAGQKVVEESGRENLRQIFIPDVLKVDLSTGPVPLAGGRAVDGSPELPDEAGFSRFGKFGPGDGDVVLSKLTGKPVSSGFPNGRRLGDDVVDIVIFELLSGDPLAPPIHVPDTGGGFDNVAGNDVAFNQTFPYLGSAHNGRATRKRVTEELPEKHARK